MTSTRPATRIRRATESDVETITAVLTEAYLEDPIGAWLVPDFDTRSVVYRDYLAIRAERALTRGLVDITTDGNAVAMWFPSLGKVSPPRDYDKRLAQVCGSSLPRFQLLHASFEQRQPQTPHHYLAFLAVSPALQGTGMGTALLEHHHTRLDLPAYLEASTERSRDLFLACGYSLRADSPLCLPDGGPPVWTMWREAEDTLASDEPHGRGPGLSLRCY